MTSYKPQEKYDAENTKRFTLKVNIKTEKDILDKLNTVPSKQGYIKQLIRADLTRGGNGMKAKCGNCNKYVKAVPVKDGEKEEVEFVCKKCGIVNSFVEFEERKCQRGE